jgi:hypothetical protein
MKKDQAAADMLLSPDTQSTRYCHKVLCTAPLDQQGSHIRFSAHSLMTRSDLRVHMSRAQEQTSGSSEAHLYTLAQQHAPDTLHKTLAPDHCMVQDMREL